MNSNSNSLPRHRPWLVQHAWTVAYLALVIALLIIAPMLLGGSGR